MFSGVIMRVVFWALVSALTLTLGLAGCNGGGGAGSGDDSLADIPRDESAPEDVEQEEAPEESSVEETLPDTSQEMADEPIACEYPENNGLIDLGKIMPALAWDNAFLGDGTPLRFDLHDFHCAPEWDPYSILIFVVVAGWCPACPDLVTYVDEISESLLAAGAMIAYVLIETDGGQPATSADASDYLGGIIEDGPGLRLGDGVTLPDAGAINRAAIMADFPGSFIVRRSDMRIIADQDTYGAILPYLDIASDPDSAWDTPDPTGDPNCGPEDEEEYEPNNELSQAALLMPGEVDGGICDDRPDFYRIVLTGHWLLQVEFQNSVGDLDLYVWDAENDQPLTDQSGRPIGSLTSDDDEVLQWLGPATIQIVGYNGSTTPYKLILVSLD